MIRGYVGWPGSGKTLNAVRDVMEVFRKERRQVFTNMAGLRFPGAAYLEDLDAVARIGRGIVLLDEVGICMSSRYWQSVSRDVLMAFAQVRKNGLDLYWTSQHEARVDTVLREITNELVRCRKIGRYTLLVSQDPAAKVQFGKRLRRDSTDVYGLYDTLEVIGKDGRGGQSGAASGAVAPGFPAFWQGPRDERRVIAPWNRLSAFRWYDGRARLTKEGQSAFRWLRENGIVPPGYPRWAEVVTHEVRRRAWLRIFGLTSDEVPTWCRPEHGWIPGWSPSEVVANRAKEELVVAERKYRRASRNTSGGVALVVE